MRKLTLSLLAAAMLAAPAAASAQATGQQIPVPGPILTKLGSTPMIELWDGGGGLPYLGAPASYNAGDWENALRTYHDSGVYDQQIAKVDNVARLWLSRAGARHGNAQFKFKRRGARGVKLVRTARHHGRGHGKPAIVFDVDETLLSNYSAIDKDNFTFGPASQAEATDEIGKAIAPSLALYRYAQSRGIATFLITGRRENTRAHTASNLAREGFTGYKRARPQAGGLDRERRWTTSRARARRSRIRATRSSRASATSTPTSPAATRPSRSSCPTRSTSCRSGPRPAPLPRRGPHPPQLRTQSANAGPVRIAPGPGSAPPFAYSSASGIDGSMPRLDPQRLAALGDEQPRRLLSDSSRGPATSVIPPGAKSAAIAASTTTSATARAATSCVRIGPDVADVALPAPVDELRDELVELRGADDVDRDRPGERDALLRELGGVVAAAEAVDPDDRDDDHPLHAGPLPRGLQVAAAAVKKAVASASSGDGPVAASMIVPTPSSAASSPSPVMTSTPVDRDIGTAS